ncbi:LysR family transcriptional regulator [Verticiella sediminum]
MAETLSFSRAAAKIGMTQPAFSQMIRELESLLELRLFDRTTRHVALTPAGRQLLSQMQRGVGEIESACRNALSLARLERGRLALAVLPSLAFGFVMPALAEFRAAYPGIGIHLHEDHNAMLLEKVRQHEVEFALCGYADTDAGLHFEQLFVDELVCVMPAGHRHTSLAVLPWQDLRDESMIVVSASSTTNARVRDAMLRHAGGKVAEYEVLNMVTALSMVRTGFGVTIIPRVALAELNMRGLVFRSLGEPRPLRRVGLYRRSDHMLSPAAEQFRRLLIERPMPDLAPVPAGRRARRRRPRPGA